MTVTRREFLVRGGLAVASTWLSNPVLAAAERNTPAPPDLADWNTVKAQFALSREFLHFASFFIASHPKPVRDAIDGFRRAIDDNPFVAVEHGMFTSLEDNVQLRALSEAAAYMHVGVEHLALVPNTTTGLAIVYHGLPLAAGDEILVTTHDHYVHHECARFAAQRTGASVRRIALHERPAEASTAEILARIRREIRPATRVLGITWVHSSTGVRLPVRLIAEAVAEINRARSEADRVVLVVDGVHGFGAVAEVVGELGCDYFCAGTHKWIFAPRGTGIVCATPEAWARLRPLVPSFLDFESFEAWMQERPVRGPTTAMMMSPGGFQAFEHHWAMGEAFRFHQRIGPGRVGRRIQELNDQCKAGLASIRGVTLHTPRAPELSAGIACFEVAGHEPAAVVAKLLERKIVASPSPYRVTYVRLAPSLVNSPEEVDKALRAVREIAAA